MKNYNSYYYLLCMLLIMGAFASMAQNSYGLKIMGFVSFSFCLLFLIQLISAIRKNGKIDFGQIAELSGLTILSLILGLRVFFIHFAFVEILFFLSGAVLVVVFGLKMLQSYRNLKIESPGLAGLVAIFYCSILLFILSMITVPFLSGVGQPLGALAFILLIIFLSISFFKGSFLLQGEKVTPLEIIGKPNDRSPLLASLFFLFSLYLGLTMVGVLPGMYSDEFPKAYFELVNEAETGKEDPVDRKYRHEVFKEKYDQFLNNHKSRNK